MKRLHVFHRVLLALLTGGLPPVLSAAPPDHGGLPNRPAVPAGSPPEHASGLPDFSGLAVIPQVRADPFQPSPLLQQKALQAQGGVQFVALPGAKSPAMKLKGLVNKTLALIEIEGAGVHLVRAGDTLSLNKTGENLVIKIEKVDALSLNVKVGTLEEMIVVR